MEEDFAMQLWSYIVPFCSTLILKLLYLSTQ